jgi:PPOX class probable F420-dependent enzyme
MSSTIPDSHRDLIDGPILVTFTTIMPDGQPQSTIVWCNSKGDNVLVNSAVGRRKDKNIRRDPRVTIMAMDPNDPYRWLEVRGVVEAISKEGGVDHIDELARLYANAPAYYGHVTPAEQAANETRVIYRIRPARVIAFGE